MSGRRLLGLALACAALTAAGLGAIAAPRGGAGGASARAGTPVLAAVQQAVEPPAGGAGAEAAVPMRLAYPTALPDSAGRSIAERWCLVCHSAMLITQQAKDSTGWEKTLTQMEKWGVAVTPEERDTLRAYLMLSFGPRAAPAPARDAAPAQPR